MLTIPSSDANSDADCLMLAVANQQTAIIKYWKSDEMEMDCKNLTQLINKTN